MGPPARGAQRPVGVAELITVGRPVQRDVPRVARVAGRLAQHRRQRERQADQLAGSRELRPRGHQLLTCCRSAYFPIDIYLDP
jgi:hypothetical protein